MFNKTLAKRMYGVDSERDLRNKINGERSGITNGELDCILKHIDLQSDPVYCEVGVYFGGTFRKVLEHLNMMKMGSVSAIGIDLFEDLEKYTKDDQTHEKLNKWNILNVAVRDELDEKLKELGFKDFVLVKGISDQALESLKGAYKPTLIFLDGNHTYDQTMKDFLAARDLLVLSGGGKIVFHNASNDIEPDPRYVKADGGPWKVCEDIRDIDGVRFVEQVERCQVFEIEVLSE